MNKPRPLNVRSVFAAELIWYKEILSVKMNCIFTFISEGDKDHVSRVIVQTMQDKYK